MQRFAVFELRQGVFQRAPSGFAACAVAVETEIDVVGLAHQDFDVLGGSGGAECGDTVADAELRQGDDVHIAFHHQNTARVFNGSAAFIQAVEVFALVKQRRIGRVEVFRFGIVQYAPAETDDLPARVTDGKHDAVAEAVVMLAFVGDDHAAVHQRGVGIGLEYLRKRLPAVGRVA